MSPLRSNSAFPSQTFPILDLGSVGSREAASSESWGLSFFLASRPSGGGECDADLPWPWRGQGEGRQEVRLRKLAGSQRLLSQDSCV